uniref:polynucleotide adenylyltransferase n=1 Tax=Globodera rostochiensis TaxID=31243 RepID=A0A914HZ63_GLORO
MGRTTNEENNTTNSLKEKNYYLIVLGRGFFDSANSRTHPPALNLDHQSLLISRSLLCCNFEIFWGVVTVRISVSHFIHFRTMHFGTAQDYDVKDCAICNEGVQLADRLVVEKETIHKGCFKCAFCGTRLQVGNCAMELSFYNRYGPRWYCSLICAHLPTGEKEAKLKELGVQKTTEAESAWKKRSLADQLNDFSKMSSLIKIIFLLFDFWTVFGLFDIGNLYIQMIRRSDRRRDAAQFNAAKIIAVLRPEGTEKVIALDELFADFLFTSDDELFNSERFGLKRMMAMEYFDKKIREMIDTISSTIMQIEDNNKSGRKDGEEIVNSAENTTGKEANSKKKQKKKERKEKKATETKKNNNSEKGVQFVEGLEQNYMALQLSIDGACEERDICRLWAFQLLLNRIQLMINGEKLDFDFWQDIDQISRKRDLEFCDRLEMIRTHQLLMAYKLALEQLLNNDSLEEMSGEHQKLSNLFSLEKVPGENELNFRLRKVNISSQQQTFSSIRLRLLELFGENHYYVNTLEQQYPTLTAHKIDILKWISISYKKLFSAASKLEQMKARFSIELLAYFNLLEQKFDVGLLEDWPEVRQTIAKYVDGIKSESDLDHKHKNNNISFYLEKILKLFKKEVQEEMLKNGEQAISNNGQIHLQLLNTSFKRKNQLKNIIREMSGTEFIRRVFLLIEDSDMANFEKITQNYRLLMAKMPQWYLGTIDPYFEQCPALFFDGKTHKNYRDREADKLVESYRMCLSNELFASVLTSTNVGLLEINFAAIIWLFSSFVDELLLCADELLGAEKDAVLDQLWRHRIEEVIWHEQMAANVPISTRLCRVLRFAISLVNDLWREMDGNQKEILANWFRDNRWTEFSLINDTLDNLVEGQNDKLISDDEMILAFEMSPNRELIHSLTLFRLIKRFDHFANFFCLQNDKQFHKTKDNLRIIINSFNEFDWLEQKFPFVLRIEELNHKMRIFWYRKLLSNRSWKGESLKLLARVIVPLLLEELEHKLTHKSIENHADFVALEDFVLVVKLEVFRAVASMRSACWLMYACQYVDNYDETALKSATLIATREMIDECTKMNGRIKIFSDIWEWLRLKHFQFLRGGEVSAETEPPLNEVILDKMTPPGARARLVKLVGPKSFALLLEQNQQLLQDTKVFSDGRLAYHYIETVSVAKDELDRLSNKLAADLIVFVRWFDAEPKGAKMERMWREKRKFLAWEYDQMFDMAGDLFTTMSFYEAFFVGLRNFLLGHKNVVSAKVLKDGWERAWKKALNDVNNDIEKQQHRTVRIVMPAWVLARHAEEFRKLLLGETDLAETDLRDRFKKDLKICLERSTSARQYLQYLLELSAANEFFQMLGIKVNQKDLKYELEEVKESARKELVAKKKKKKVKKGREGTKEVDKEKEMENGGDGRKEMENGRKEMENGRKEMENGGDGRKEMENERKEMENGGDGRKEMENERKEMENGRKEMENGGDGRKEMENGRKEMENGGDGRKEMENERKEMGNGRDGRKEMENGRDERKEDFETVSRTEDVEADDGKDDDQTCGRNTEGDEVHGRRLLVGDAESEMIEEKDDKMNGKKKATEGETETIGDEQKTKAKASKNRENVEKGGKRKEEAAKRNQIGAKKEATIKGEILLKDVKTDEFLSLKYLELLSGTVDDEPNNFALLLELGTYANEIWHRVEVLEQLRGLEKKAQIWCNLTKDRQIRFLTAIFGTESTNRKGKEAKRKEFVKYLEQWKKAMDQLEFDEKLFGEFVDKDLIQTENSHKLALNRNFVENLQQINLTEEAKNDNAIFEEYYNEFNREIEEKVNTELGTIRQIVDKWSNKMGKLFVGGSLQLKMYMKGSDIDTICIVPEHFGPDDFFGTQRQCELEEWPKSAENGGESSLFCMLYKHPDVRSLRRIPFARVPIIRLVLRSGLEFDIVFVSIPGIRTLSINKKGEILNVDKLIAKLADHIKSDASARDGEINRRMLRSLAGFNSNLKLLEMAPNIDTFRKFVLVLKRWSKNNYIYGNVLGFLNGISLCVLAMKIILLFPNASIPFLLERFFIFYSIWPLPLPIQLGTFKPDVFSWSPEEELRQLVPQFGFGVSSKLSMPIITPGYPEQNSTFNINFKNAQIIKNAIKNALIELQTPTSAFLKEKWQNILRQQRFSEMYSEFFAIICFASDWELSEEFCGFVGTRLRNQLMIGSTECITNLCHVMAPRECPEKIVQNYKIMQTKSAASICKSWLVGIKGQKFDKLSTEIRNLNWGRDLDEQILFSYKKVLNRNYEKKPLNLAEKIRWN